MSTEALTPAEVLEQFKQLPDWDRYPLPGAYYTAFNLPKPKPSVSLMEVLAYQAPPHVNLNKNGKVEIRPPAEGGVRQIDQLLTLPVEVKKVNEETGDLEEFPPPKLLTDSTLQTMIDQMAATTQSAACKQPDSDQMTSTPPTEGTTTETQPASDLPSQDLCDAYPYISPSVLCHDAECNPASQRHRSESFSSDLGLSETQPSISSPDGQTLSH